jgi:ABC-type glutathione transport system ATPase component
MTVVMSLENVTLEYPVDRRYRKEKVKPSGVQNISLEIQRGEVLGII